MAGLEVLYSCVGGSISCPQDAVVCFVHWEMIKSGYRCIGSGDEPKGSDKKSELLPTDWNSNREELYSLRYKAKDSETQLLLKAISVDSTLIFNLMNSGTQQVSDLTVNISDHVEADQLHTFDSVFKDTDSLSEKVKTQLMPAQGRAPGQRTSRRDEEDERRRREDSDPLRIPIRQPRQGPPPHWCVNTGGCLFKSIHRKYSSELMSDNMSYISYKSSKYTDIFLYYISIVSHFKIFVLD
ncbi:proteasome inhibitor PI31 subunit-like [Notothenia coriiceps]|uniref:Proteasome inhibitor PI31 subunit n=1 Tax=Notothenia coriiceps TaxID=8208 RepID=A0A6I9PMI2_9TELE|nr:PREDICTED: proteasome inhibitor PI31 subunit-like [Notothenia coriiceps]